MFFIGAQINDQTLIIISDHQITLLQWWRKLTSVLRSLGHDCVLDYCHCFYFETSKYKILCRHQGTMNTISRSHSSTGISPCVQVKLKGKPKMVVVKVINTLGVPVEQFVSWNTCVLWKTTDHCMKEGWPSIGNNQVGGKVVQVQSRSSDVKHKWCIFAGIWCRSWLMYRYQKVSHSLMKASLFSDIHLKKALHSYISPHSGHLWGAHIPNQEYYFLASSQINAVYLLFPVIEV
jgi:hypothetical protein